MARIKVIQLTDSQLLFLFLVLTLFSSCNSTRQQQVTKSSQLIDNECFEMKYASHLKLECEKSINGKICFKVKIRNPWDTTKILSERNYQFQPSFCNALIFTTLHAHLIKELGALNCIGGVGDSGYIIDNDIQNLISQGKIQDIGSSLSLDIERIMAMKPDGIFISPFESSNFDALYEMGVPVVLCADYMELSPLAQAEWMKYYGFLFNRFQEADSLFKVVENEYNNSIFQTQELSQLPKILPNIMLGDKWYVPTAKSTAGQIYKDAGCIYPFDYLGGNGSVPLDFETVFAKAYDADFWIFKYNANEDYTLKTLAKENPNYQKFKAFKDKNVYGCNLNYSMFYDETPFRPDFYIKDLIKIFHPEILPDYELRYFKKLK